MSLDQNNLETPTAEVDEPTSIKDAIAEYDFFSAREHTGKIRRLSDKLSQENPDFNTLLNELSYEGLRILEPGYVDTLDITHLGSNGALYNSRDELVTNVQNIDHKYTAAVKLAALQYFVHMQDNRETYTPSNNEALKARLATDLQGIIEQERLHQKDVQERQEREEAIFTAERNEHRAIIHKEFVSAFKETGIPLNDKLAHMLHEPDDMQGGRPGSGFTNLFRELSNYVNNDLNNPLKLFDTIAIEDILDLQPGVRLSTEQKIQALGLEEKFKHIQEKLIHPSHHIALSMMHDILLGTEKNLPQLNIETNQDELNKIGTCTTAERYFFEWGGLRELKDFQGSYGGTMTVITTDQGVPCMIRKNGMGEQGSCLTLTPLVMGKVEIPAGSFVQAIPNENTHGTPTNNDLFPEVIASNDFDGFRFLRLSTLALKPNDRMAAFGNHYFQQKKEDFANYDWIETKHYQELIENILSRGK